MVSEHRESRLTIDLGGEQIEYVGLTARERLSEPFEIDLQITAPLGELDLAPHLGEKIAVALFEEQDEVRYFNGVLVEAEHLLEDGEGFSYGLLLRPFTHFMESQIGYAIYQEKTVIDIIKDVFQRAGITDFELRNAETYEPFEYCVQYGESDFHFISRLMEQEGLYYFYEHSEKKHLMVITDRASKHKPAPNADVLAFNASAKSAQSYRVGDELGGKHVIEAWHEKITSSGHKKVSLRDYDFKKPAKAVDTAATDQGQHPEDAKELYAYPGKFVDKTRADRLSKVRLEELRATRQLYYGTSTAKGICAGATLKVENHPTGRLNGDYMVISTSHRLRTEHYHSGGGKNDRDEVDFVAIPAKTQYRAPRVTQKPKVLGIESAIVTGPSGETIYTDEYGRIKVRFHWDREKTPDEQSTCWIRVSQTGGLGNVILPRVGHEVLVDFLHGDPDHPVITGRVFNQEHMPTYELPANKTRALWRTLTYGNMGPSYPNAEALDTGEPKANEIRFEDKGGEEEIFIHSERDMNVRIRYDMTRHVGHNEEIKVGYDSDRYVKNDEKEVIDGNRQYTLKKNETNEITDGNRKTTISKGNDDLKVAMGDISIKANMGKITLEAMQSIELKVGATTLKLTPAGADIDSPMINVKAKGMAEVSAGGILTEKGALVKIN